MKHFIKTIAAAAAAILAVSCEDFTGIPSGGRQSTISWHFDEGVFPPTKAAAEVPDTNDFLITITDSNGKTLYDGKYGESPDKLIVEAGSYTVSVKSREFSTPAFDTPQYGDTQVLVVKKGERATALLNCVLMNAGIRLRTASNFLTAYPNAILYIKSADGRLMYSRTEKRVAYFKPSSVSVVMSEDGTEKTVFTRTLAAREVLTISIAAPAGAAQTSGNTVIAVDTLKTWISEDFTIGGSGGAGDTKDKALSVSQAASSAGRNDVWVYGYIVGGDLTSTGSTMNTGPTFTKDTHFAIASRASTTSKASCLAVELKKTDIRAALNLKDNPSNKGRQVFLKGDIVDSYFGIPGLKNVTEYELK